MSEEAESWAHVGVCEDERAAAGRRGAHKPQLERVYRGDARAHPHLSCLTASLHGFTVAPELLRCNVGFGSGTRSFACSVIPQDWRAGLASHSRFLKSREKGGNLAPWDTRATLQGSENKRWMLNVVHRSTLLQKERAQKCAKKLQRWRHPPSPRDFWRRAVPTAPSSATSSELLKGER